MSSRKTPVGKPFPKGVSGNPGGRAKMPEDVKRANNLTAVEFIRLTNKYLGLSKEELIQALKDPAATTLELMIGSIMHKAVVEGDQKRLDFLLDRLVGKVKDPSITQIGVMTSGQAQVVIQIPDNKRSVDEREE